MSEMSAADLRLLVDVWIANVLELRRRRLIDMEWRREEDMKGSLPQYNYNTGE